MSLNAHLTAVLDILGRARVEGRYAMFDRRGEGGGLAQSFQLVEHDLSTASHGRENIAL
jgi:hypothetical protein